MTALLEGKPGARVEAGDPGGETQGVLDLTDPATDDRHQLADRDRRVLVPYERADCPPGHWLG